MDNINPVTKQYILFSIIIGGIASFVLNFLIIEAFKGTIAYGFPFNLNTASGFSGFIQRVLDTIIFTALLAVPIYLGIQWLLRRQRGF